MAGLLSAQPDFQVVGSCSDEAGLRHLLEARKPEILLVDLELPGLSLFSFLRRLQRTQSPLSVLVMSRLPGERYALRAIRAGAMGFFSKLDPPATLFSALRAVRAGHIWIRRSHLLPALSSLGEENPAEPAALAALSDRELEVFRLLGAGMRTKAVAAELHISPSTVASHRFRIYRKLGIRSPNELIRVSASEGMGKGPGE
jgi:DNA-binding NarL/FixJ family response regulator